MKEYITKIGDLSSIVEAKNEEEAKLKFIQSRVNDIKFVVNRNTLALVERLLPTRIQVIEYDAQNEVRLLLNEL